MCGGGAVEPALYLTYTSTPCEAANEVGLLSGDAFASRWNTRRAGLKASPHGAECALECDDPVVFPVAIT